MITMEMRSIAVFVVFALASSFQILAQSANGVESADCSDPLSGLQSECIQNQQQYREQYQQQNQQLTSPANLGFDSVRSLRPTTQISPLEENAPLTGSARPQALEHVLPPDQPTEFQRFVAATVGQLLPIYGASLFRSVPTTFAPSDLAPAMPEYVIGPDDELRIRIWGQINYSGNLRVDRSGNIFLPQVGTIHVAGFQFASLDHHLREAVGKMYRNFDLSVDLGRIRSMQIYITGQARRPGVYTVSSLSSLVNALFASGGPSPQGSLRHIYLRREGKTIADFDLYALLISGDKSHDVRLLPEDVVYISPAGPQVAIVGSIRNPGIYELKTADTIRNVIDAAGEVTAMASNARISLERIENRQYRAAMEVNFDERGLATLLHDGDIVRVFPIVPAYSKTVTLRGNVANPGHFGWHVGMHLADIIPDRDSLVSRDYWWKRSHLGLPAEEFEPAISTLAQSNRSNQDRQRVGIMRSTSASEVSSEPTTFTLSDELRDGTREPNDQLPKAGQNSANASLAVQFQQQTTDNTQNKNNANDISLSNPEINWNYAVIERMDPATLRTSLIPFDLGKLVINHDANQDLALEPGDTITIFSQADIRVPLEQQTKYVRLEGEVEHAGVYSVRPGETLQDLVQRAGGLTNKAYLYGAEFTRESTRILQQQRLNEYVRAVSMEAERGTQALAVTGVSSGSNASDVSASRAVTEQLLARLSQIRATGRIVLQLSPNSNTLVDIPKLNLQNGDRLTIPPIPDTINVIGAVYDQNSFLYHRGQTVSYYLKLAGGMSRNADKTHAFVIRADGSVVSRSAMKSGWSYWEGNSFNNLRLSPGDTIMIPDKTLRPSALRGFTEWSQVFSQLALGAAAINVL